MGKKMVYLILAFLLTVMSPLSVMAEALQGGAGWSVQFDGSKIESTFKSSEISDQIYNMQPGDTAEFRIALENEAEGLADWYMSNEILQSLENSQNAANGGVYTYILTYIDASGSRTDIYNSENVGGENNSGGTGLYQAADSLEEFYFLDQLSENEKGEIVLLVGLEGETQGNSYQNTLASLQMNFAVEPTTEPVDPDPPSDPGTPDDPRTPIRRVTVRKPGSNLVRAPKTGDDSQILQYALISLAAGMVCIIWFALRIKKRYEEETDKNTQTGRGS